MNNDFTSWVALKLLGNVFGQKANTNSMPNHSLNTNI